MTENLIENPHSMILEKRKDCKMTGVLDVTAFDEHIILLKTQLGDLEIRGEELHIKELTLENGTIEIEGLVNSLEYQDKGIRKQGESFWKRLLR